MGLLTDPGRNDQFAKTLIQYHTKLSILAYVIGICWLFALVHEDVNLRVKSSENALLSGLVQSEFTSEHEDFAKKEYDSLVKLQKVTELSFPHDELKGAFRKIGLEVYDHHFNYSSKHSDQKVIHGRNIYAILRASRASSLESVVFTVPYRAATSKLPRTDGGIALMLALAYQFSHQPYWAKDVIFLITDHEHIGAKAWVEAYHGVYGSPQSPLTSTPLENRAGAIQAALVLEIPSPYVQYVDIRLVGINGQMPNLDLFTLCRTLFGKQDIPLMIQGDTQTPSYAPDHVRELKTAARMIASAASGALEGNHGFFQKFNIQSLTVRGITQGLYGGRGRAGFHDLGVALEGICRSLNNLLERFHQSYFFYILSCPYRFVSIGLYMPPLGLIVLPVVLKALALWAQGSLSATSDQPKTSSSTVGTVLPWILLGHGLSIGTFFVQANMGGLDGFPLSSLLLAFSIVAFSLPFAISRFLLKEDADLLKSVNLIEMGVGLYALSMLNFPLALVIAIGAVPVAVFICHRDDLPRPLRPLAALILALSFPLIPLAVVSYSGSFSELSRLYPDYSALSQELFSGISEVFLQYHEYGNWLAPVVFLFLLPVWISNWIVFWG